MPIGVWYIIALFVVICAAFLLFKRPIYECMFYGYLAMVLLTNEWRNFFVYIGKSATDTLFYAIVAFLVLARILDETKAVDKVVAIIMALFGRLRGGAGYTAIIGSTFMGALSGSGAGNVATTGTFTIPAMKKSGFPPELAANVESVSSTMGNMIPPAGVIVTALACYNEFSGAEMSQSLFWLSMWGVSLWFVLQRIVTLYVFCRIYKLKPMAKEDVPSLREAMKDGAIYLLLPVVILLPFVLDYFFKAGFFTARLGEGAERCPAAFFCLHRVWRRLWRCVCPESIKKSLRRNCVRFWGIRPVLLFRWRRRSFLLTASVISFPVLALGRV